MPRLEAAHVLGALDAAAVLGAVLGTVALLGAGGSPHAATPHGSMPANVLLTWVGLLAGLSTKRLWKRSRVWPIGSLAEDSFRIVEGLALGTLFALGAELVFSRGSAGPALPATWFGEAASASLAALILVRALWAATAGHTTWSRARVLVVGTDKMAEEAASRLERQHGVTLVGFVDDDPLDGHAVLGGLADLPAVCAAAKVDGILVAFPHLHPASATNALRSVRPSIAIAVLPRYFELTGWPSEMEFLDGLPVMRLASPPGGTIVRTLKRGIDIAAALSALVIAFPILVGAGILMKLASPGPIVFRQTRIGRFGKPFTILKLRTMATDDRAADDPHDERPPDLSAPRGREPGCNEWNPRIGMVGRLLRRSAIDELPQLVNVLRGDMSLVGPRPFVPDESEYATGLAVHRFEMRPGMTGLWQVSGQHDLSIDELRRLDDIYVSTWSLANDLLILLRTPRRLVKGGRMKAPRPGSQGQAPAIPAPARIRTARALASPSHS